MAITEILVHVDATPAAETRLRAAVDLAAASQAHVSALYLVAQPFLPSLGGKHLPEELVRQQLAAFETEADERMQALTALVADRGVTLETRRETASLDRLPVVLARQGRRADLIVVGPGTDPDEAALAMSLPRIGPEGREQVGGGEAQSNGVIGLLGPGTGLRVSGLVPTGDRWTTLATEGGHVSFAPADERELRVLSYAWKSLPHVSAERLVSGPGLEIIYQALTEGRTDVPAQSSRSSRSVSSSRPP